MAPAHHQLLQEQESFFGESTITASVVKNIAAVDTAFSNATLRTLAGSIIPALNKSLNSHDFASKP
jgi:hypothetical protein